MITASILLGMFIGGTLAYYDVGAFGLKLTPGQRLCTNECPNEGDMPPLQVTLPPCPPFNGQEPCSFFRGNMTCDCGGD